LYENFEKLPDEKKKMIIEICIEEFADKGYVNASTNNIVKNANISKGALFNYFGNKKNLFLYIMDYATNYYMDYLITRMKKNSPDFFERILDWAKLKLQVSLEEPTIYNFFLVAYSNIPEELTKDVEKRYAKLYEKGVVLSFEGLDLSLFREDIDRQKAIELLLVTFNGLSEKQLKLVNLIEDKGFSTLNERLEELKACIALLRKVFYKQN